MGGSNTRALRQAAQLAFAVLGLAGCERFRTALGVAPLLDRATQQAAAEKLTDAYAEVCLSAQDAGEAARALEAKGWPRFTTVWNAPDSVFYAAKPSPAGLFVNGDRRRVGQPTYALTCTGHYQADGAQPMLAAMRARWGADREGSRVYPGSRAWAFVLDRGRLSALPDVGFPTAAQRAALRPGQALVYSQVSYQPAQHDVASMVSIVRPTGS
jgi:hypothetical protein